MQREERQRAAAMLRYDNAKKEEEEEFAREEEAKEDKSPAAVKTRAKDLFFRSIKNSNDLEDNLQELVDFIQEQTGATGVYFGKLVYPAREIDEDADDKAHYDEEAPKVIKYSHASKGHEFMVDVVYSEERAPLSHAVFKESDEGEG